MSKYQEAKEILKLYDYSTKLELSEGVKNDITENISVTQFMQMKKICLEVLDKATPMKVEEPYKIKGEGLPVSECPNCTAFIRGGNYCGHCGQAIDWME